MTPAAAVYVGLVLARVGAFAAVLPPFAGRTPRSVRAALAVALTAFYAGVAAPQWDAEFARRAADVHPLVYAVALAREAVIGSAMGFAFALFLLPARLAGEFVTQQIGLAVSPQAGPTGDTGGPIALAFESLGGMLFLAADAHHVVIGVLHASFAAAPLGGPGVPQAGPLVGGLQSAYELGVLLGGPLALCLFLLAVLMAVMARAAPQLNVYSIGFTLQVIVALTATLFLLPEIARTTLAAIARTGESLPGYLR